MVVLVFVLQIYIYGNISLLMAYKIHIIQPREPSQRTFTAVRESLPHACFYRSSDAAFEAKLYPKQDVVVKVATPGSTA
jgi:hypothetical protein